MALALAIGFLIGVLSVIVAEAIGILWVIRRLSSSRTRRSVLSQSQNQNENQVVDLDPHQSLPHAYNKEGSVWILESDSVPKVQTANKISKEQKKKEVWEVHPVRKHAKIKDRCLILTESDGSTTRIQLRGCKVLAVSATGLSSKKWAKRYPIKVESKTSEIYSGSKTSWEKESWCKALRFASCDDKETLKWLVQLSEEFHSYLSYLNTSYPSFMKPSIHNAEPLDKANRLDGSSSKVRHFLKKLAKKASKGGGDYRSSLNMPTFHEECSFEDSASALSSVKAMSKEKAIDSRPFENVALQSTPMLSHLGSQSQISGISQADPDDKFSIDEGTLCFNLLISRLFFDAKNNAKMKSALQARIQSTVSNMRTPSYIGQITCSYINLGNIPPCIHSMRVLPADMNEVWAVEFDIEYAGGFLLNVETRIEVHEVDFQEGISSTNSREVTSDIHDDIEYVGKQLKPPEATVNSDMQREEGDPQTDGNKGFNNNTRASGSASRWKSILNNIAKQVSQVPLSLAIRIASLRGTIRLHIKPPPSDQLWFGFTMMPEIDFNLESSVGEHKINSGHVSLILINRFKAAIRESLVLPNCESLCISWMLAEKDDWIPRDIAPFMWLNQDAVNDPTVLREVTNSQASDLKRTQMGTETLKDHLNNKHRELDTTESAEQGKPESPEALAPSVDSASQPKQSSKTLELGTSSLQLHSEQAASNQHGEHAGCQSPSKSSNFRQEQRQITEDETKLKKLGRRARMLDFGKKVGERLEEKRRHFEEKGKNIVEKIRGP
ncbi:hypothetical protein RJ641_014999 [Dillenia turbinata]|uniref:SMP-LTD domain-containing protein n=1 Tax=Dillenia turbinata TaxID=194707 RepID=A0AAN8V0A1_9MAGN